MSRNDIFTACNGHLVPCPIACLAWKLRLAAGGSGRRLPPVWVAEGLHASGLAYYAPYARTAYGGAPEPRSAMWWLLRIYLHNCNFCTFSIGFHHLCLLRLKEQRNSIFPAIDTCYNFFFNMYETSHAQYFLSFLLLCTRFTGSRRRSPSGWMHLHTARKQWHIKKCNYWSWVTKASRVPSYHLIFTRTAYTGCYTHRALCSDLLHFLSQPWVERHCHICTFIHRNLSSLNLLWDLLGFFFQRSFSCKTSWRTVAIVHDVMHCAQHCNQHVGDVWMMIMFAICGRALVVLAAAAVVAYKSLLAESATTETSSLVLMPCSTEHSGDSPLLSSIAQYQSVQLSAV